MLHSPCCLLSCLLSSLPRAGACPWMLGPKLLPPQQQYLLRFDHCLPSSQLPPSSIKPSAASSRLQPSAAVATPQQCHQLQVAGLLGCDEAVSDEEVDDHQAAGGGAEVREKGGGGGGGEGYRGWGQLGRSTGPTPTLGHIITTPHQHRASHQQLVLNSVVVATSCATSSSGSSWNS